MGLGQEVADILWSLASLHASPDDGLVVPAGARLAVVAEQADAQVGMRGGGGRRCGGAVDREGRRSRSRL